MSQVINKQTKIVTQIGVVITVIITVFSLGLFIARYQSRIDNNTQKIERLENIENRNLEWRSQTDQSIVRMETKLDQIYSEINKIGEYIKNNQ